MAWIARRIEPADTNFNLANPDKYNGSYGGLPRMAGYIARARTEAAAAQQDILVLHAGGLWRRQNSYGPAGCGQARAVWLSYPSGATHLVPASAHASAPDCLPLPTMASGFALLCR